MGNRLRHGLHRKKFDDDKTPTSPTGISAEGAAINGSAFVEDDGRGVATQSEAENGVARQEVEGEDEQVPQMNVPVTIVRWVSIFEIRLLRSKADVDV